MNPNPNFSGMQEVEIVDAKENFSFYRLSNGDILKVKTPLMRVMIDSNNRSNVVVAVGVSQSILIKKEEIETGIVSYGPFSLKRGKH